MTTRLNLARDTVYPNETIVSLASRLIGDPLQWPQLVQLNNLKAPYVHPAGGERVLQAGDTIIYPLRDDEGAPALAPELLDARTYKRDLVTQDGDLMVIDGMLQTVSGIENYAQALRKRVHSALGIHPFHAGFGSLLRFQVGRIGDSVRLQLITNDVVRAVMQDPRTLSATCVLEFREDVVYAVALVTPIPPGQTFTLDVPLS